MKRQEQNESEVPLELVEFTARLRTALATEQEQEADEKWKTASGMGLAWRVSLELVVAVAVGGGLGWLLDNWLGTRPWIMSLFLFLGGAAGSVNIYRVTQGLNEAIGLGYAIRHSAGTARTAEQNTKKMKEKRGDGGKPSPSI